MLSAPIAGNSTSDTIEVSWKAHPKAAEEAITGYRLYRNKGDGNKESKEDFTVCVHNGTSDPRLTYVVSDLLPNTNYQFKVSAVNSVGEGPLSPESTPVATLPEVVAVAKPGPPSNVSVGDITHDSATLKWAAPKETGGGTITGYRVYRNRHGEEGALDVVCYDDKDDARTEAKIGGLKGSNKYRFAVAAFNTAGEGPKSDPTAPILTEAEEAAKTKPGAPEAPVCGDTTKNSVQVKWLPPSNTGGGDIVGYKVAHDDASGGAKFEKVGYDGSTSTLTECVIKNLKPGSEYRFKVAAINSVGQGDWSEASKPAKTTDDTANDAPGVPLDVHVINTTDRQATISWKDSPVGPKATGYKVYRSDPNAASDNYVVGYDGSGIAQNTVIVKGLKPGTEYRFRASALNDNGESAQSEPSQIGKTLATLPGAPTDLQHDAGSGGNTLHSLQLKWSPPEDNGGDGPSGYSIVASDGEDKPHEVYREEKNPATTATVKNLKPGEEYRFKVAAINSIGMGPYSAALAIKTFVGKAATPEAPTVHNHQGESAVLHVKPPANNGSPITAYKIYSAPDANGEKKLLGEFKPSTPPANPEVFTVHGLKVGEPLVFFVSVINGLGESDISPPSALSTPGAVAPSAPGKPQVLATKASSATISFAPPTSDGGAPLKLYRIYGADKPDGPLIVVHEAPHKGTGQQTTDVPSLIADGHYVFAVAAVNQGDKEGPRGPTSDPAVIEDKEEKVRQRALREAHEAEEKKHAARRQEIIEAAKQKLFNAKPVINATIEDETGKEWVEIVSCRPGGAFHDANVPDGCLCTTVNGTNVAGNERFKKAVGTLSVGQVYPFVFCTRDAPNEKFTIDVQINGTGIENMTVLRKLLKEAQGHVDHNDLHSHK